MPGHDDAASHHHELMNHGFIPAAATTRLHFAVSLRT
jgi:hypothetical protein